MSYFLSLSVSLSVYLPACLSAVSLSLSFCLYLFVCLFFSVWESVYLSKCLSILLYLPAYLYFRLSFYASRFSLSLSHSCIAPSMRTWYSAIHPGRGSCSKSQWTPSRLSLMYAFPPVAAISSPTMQLRRSQRSCPNLISINLRWPPEPPFPFFYFSLV